MCEPYGDTCISHYSHWLHTSPAGRSSSSTVAFPCKMYEWLTTFTQQTGAWFIHCWATHTHTHTHTRAHTRAHTHIVDVSFQGSRPIVLMDLLFQPKNTNLVWLENAACCREKRSTVSISRWCRPCFSHLSLVSPRLHRSATCINSTHFSMNLWGHWCTKNTKCLETVLVFNPSGKTTVVVDEDVFKL